jgi:hypothetical protein
MLSVFLILWDASEVRLYVAAEMCLLESARRTTSISALSGCSMSTNIRIGERYHRWKDPGEGAHPDSDCLRLTSPSTVAFVGSVRIERHRVTAVE